jgi:hypothetical protein
VAERPDEQFAPNTPIFSAFALYMATRSPIDPVRANKAFSFPARRPALRERNATRNGK